MRKIMIPGHWDDIPDAVQTRSFRDDITWVPITAVCYNFPQTFTMNVISILTLFL
jgi:hypothetical protein